MANINFEIDPSVDEVFDEASGNSFLALRLIRWGDMTDYKLDMRKWFVNSVGEETPGKGVAFMTDNGPNCLINTLITKGYGATDDIVRTLRSHRPNEFILSLSERLASSDIDTINKLSKSEKAKDAYCKEYGIEREPQDDTFDPRSVIE